MLAVKVEGNKLTVTMTELQAPIIRDGANELADLYFEASEEETDPHFINQDALVADTFGELRDAIAEHFPYSMQ